jgi:DNA repair protein RadC
MCQGQAVNQSHAAKHRSRLVERALARGVNSLSESETLELVLGGVEDRAHARQVAEAMLGVWGGLRSLATARPEELVSPPGVSVEQAAAVAAAFQLGRLAATEPAPTTIRRPDDVAAIARRELAGMRRERVLVVVCDASHRVLRTVVVSEGAIDRSLVPVRELLNAVLRHDGRAFAIAHNHVCGDAEPSRTDQRATEQVKDAARLVGLRFLGHVVVGPDCRPP